MYGGDGMTTTEGLAMSSKVAESNDLRVIFKEGTVYEISTPYECFEASRQLQKLLDEKEGVIGDSGLLKSSD